MDSGSNFHVTPTPENLDNVNPVGMSHLITCTGEKARITGIGSTLFSPSKLHLNDVLIVPSATKKLLSVHKLTEDNRVHIVFTNTGCTVKDPVTGKLLWKDQQAKECTQ